MGCFWKNVVKYRDGTFWNLNRKCFLSVNGIESLKLSVSSGKQDKYYISSSNSFFFFSLRDSLDDKLLKYWQVLLVKSKQHFTGNWVVLRSVSFDVSYWCHICLSMGLLFTGAWCLWVVKARAGCLLLNSGQKNLILKLLWAWVVWLMEVGRLFGQRTCLVCITVSGNNLGFVWGYLAPYIQKVFKAFSWFHCLWWLSLIKYKRRKSLFCFSWPLLSW